MHQYPYYMHNVMYIFVYQKGDLVKHPMKSRDVLPKMFQGWGGVGLVGVGWVGNLGVGWGGSWWGESYTEQLGYRGQPSLSAHFSTLAITLNYWVSKIQLQPHT